jgi:hypothetical protein
LVFSPDLEADTNAGQRRGFPADSEAGGVMPWAVAILKSTLRVGIGICEISAARMVPVLPDKGDPIEAIFNDLSIGRSLEALRDNVL